MTTLRSIEFENYKAFASHQRIELRPLTVLIGRNSTGKSVVARLPLAIARGLANPSDTPFELSFDGLDFGTSYVDLIHKRNPHGSFVVGASFDENGSTERFSVDLQHFDEFKLLVPLKFTYALADEVVTLNWEGTDPRELSKPYRMGQTDRLCLLEFQGLFPTSAAEESGEATRNTIERLTQARNRFAAALTEMTYLGPFRSPPERSYRFPGAVRHVGAGGSQAPAVLADDVLRRRGSVLEEVSNWFAELLHGWRLDIVSQGDTFSIILRDPQEPSAEINIADVGTGIAQVLPIVVQRKLDSVQRRAGGLEVVEHPELHLHPAAHTSIADLYVAAAQATDSCFLLETHSENLLLRLRRRVAEGSLHPDKVIIYWVNDEAELGPRIQPIHILPSGEVDAWPQGVFSEDFQEVRAIRSARRPE
jgi:hypothetical protein